MIAPAYDILLVEDNISDAELTTRALKKNNILNPLLHLKDGEEALGFLFCKGDWEKMKTSNPPRLIILDLKMPKVDGIEVLRKIKSDDRLKNTPVIMLTSSKDDNEMKLCCELGASCFIVKPLVMEEFVKAIGEAVTKLLS